MSSTKTAVVLLILSLGFPGSARAQVSEEHWVASWATAQEFAPTTPDIPVVGPNITRPKFQGNRATRPTPPSDIRDQTVRMIVRTGVGGRKVRIEISNAISKKPVEIGAAHIARRASGSTIAAGTDRVVTFSGDNKIKVFPGALLVSDPVDLDLPPYSEMVVSLYIVASGGAPTTHALGLHTTYIVDGDKTASPEIQISKTTTSYMWLKGLDVLASQDSFAIVALGDSITDGFRTTVDADHAWPTLLSKRFLLTNGASKASVLNEGISGNEVLRDGAGVSALVRFDRDVLSHPGVKWLILLEGINDINIHGQVDGNDALKADDLIFGYKQLIDRAHMHNIQVIGATLTPEEGVWLAGPIGEKTRLRVNEWIRAKGNFDAVVDFDKVLRTPDQPSLIRHEFDPGDHIHPNDAGNAAMAAEFTLGTFRNTRN